MTTMENVKIQIGDVTLHGERRDDEAVSVEWFGTCPHTGAGLFLTLDNPRYLLPEDKEKHRPWSVTLWPGHADDEPAPSTTPHRFAKVSEARAALTAEYRAHLNR